MVKWCQRVLQDPILGRRPLLYSFLRKVVVDYVVQDDTAIRMNSLVDELFSAQRDDDNRQLEFHAHIQIFAQAAVRPVHDLIDGEWRGRLVRVSCIVFAKLYNLLQDNAEHSREELRMRAATTRERLSLYQKIQFRHYRSPAPSSLRRRGVYLVLMARIRQCEQYLAWLGDAEELLSERN